MGSLTATMTLELLRHDKDDKREKILKWLWEGDKWQWNRHKFLRENRVADTGRWFLCCKSFRDWCSDVGSPVLLCPGLRMLVQIVSLITSFSWRWEVFHDVSPFSKETNVQDPLWWTTFLSKLTTATARRSLYSTFTSITPNAKLKIQKTF